MAPQKVYNIQLEAATSNRLHAPVKPLCLADLGMLDVYVGHVCWTCMLGMYVGHVCWMYMLDMYTLGMDVGRV